MSKPLATIRTKESSMILDIWQKRAQRTALALFSTIHVLAAFLMLASRAWAQQGADFFTLTPCRLYDSRWEQGPLAGGFTRWIPAGGYCAGIPLDATALHLNATVVDANAGGLLSLYPCCTYSVSPAVVGFNAGSARAGNTTVGLGGGKLEALIDGPSTTQAHLVIDVSGYFRPTAAVQQWREWEATLLAPADYSANGGDPDEEVSLLVRFTRAGTTESFVFPAFWADEDGEPRFFTVRMAFPPGTWNWQIESCTRLGTSCAAGWAPTGGTIEVQSNLASGNPLYDQGFPRQELQVAGGVLVGLGDLVYPNGDKFTWVGDTAWTAPPREIHGDTAQWNAYLDDRQSKGFNLIQVAPAVTWIPKPGQSWAPLPAAAGFSFALKASCQSNPPPIGETPCWTMRKKRGQYWRKFVDMVRAANNRGMVVGVFGVMNPGGIDTNLRYPNPTRITAFVRTLAAMLGGVGVIYSPAFDDDSRKIDPASQQPRSVLMNAVGAQLKALLDRPGANYVQPLTNHLAGGMNNCDDYTAFAPNDSSRWMTHFLFQSGHGGNNVHPGACAPTGTTDVERAVERARVMSLTLDAYSSPALPAVNSEGPYDSTNFATTTQTVDTRTRVRHVAYVSALSNALGFGYGADGLSLWDQPGGNFGNEPSLYFGLQSSEDMKHFGANFRTHSLTAHHEWIENNPPEQRYKQVLASDESNVIYAYLPGGELGPESSKATIDIQAAQLQCQVCPSASTAPWSFTWVDPTRNAVVLAGSCSASSGRLTFTRPACDLENNPSCDWLLKVVKTNGSCPSGGAATSFAAAGPAVPEAITAVNSLEVWDDSSAGDGTSAIYAASHSGNERDEPFLISPSGLAFQTSPRVDRVAEKQIVVWRADGLDGSLAGIFGALVGPTGEVEGPFQINHYTENDQREPAVAGGPGGKALVVWSSYDHDGDRGGIYGRFVRPNRPPSEVPQDYFGQEFQIAEITAGHQQRPQVIADQDGYWVAWETVDEKGLRSTLGFRRLDRDGQPEDPEVRLLAPPGQQQRLIGLERATPNSLVVHWWGQNAAGRESHRLEQTIGPQGPLSLVSPGGGQP
jgi:Protein of unknown function (DUF4038)